MHVIHVFSLVSLFCHIALAVSLTRSRRRKRWHGVSHVPQKRWHEVAHVPNNLRRIRKHDYRIRSARTADKFRQDLVNVGDVEYTGTMSMGGELVQIIPDTGSFDLVVFSEECGACTSQNDQGNLYNNSKSSTYRRGTLQQQQLYGSGSTDSIESYDDIKLGPLEVHHQMFWNVFDADMPVAADGTFQGIFGLGPPKSCQNMAKEDVNSVNKQLKDLKRQGKNLHQYAAVVKQVYDIAKFTKTSKLWLTNLGMRSFSVCLTQASRGPGFLVYNDNTPEAYPELFIKVDVTGDTYWSTALQHVNVGTVAGSDVDEKVSLGCDKPDECLAVLDTGTSLISAPEDTVKKLVKIVDEWNKQNLGCTDLSKLPDLEFMLGGHKFTLPPRSYVGEMSGAIPKWAHEHMPHLQIFKTRHEKRNLDSDNWCAPLVMGMPPDPRDPDPKATWILGLPFFRRYYTNFRLTDDSMQAQSLSFAMANDQCEVGFSDLRLPQQFQGPMRIDLQRLRPPRSLKARTIDSYRTSRRPTTRRGTRKSHESKSSLRKGA